MHVSIQRVGWCFWGKHRRQLVEVLIYHSPRSRRRRRRLEPRGGCRSSKDRWQKTERETVECKVSGAGRVQGETWHSDGIHRWPCRGPPPCETQQMVPDQTGWLQWNRLVPHDRAPSNEIEQDWILLGSPRGYLTGSVWGGEEVQEYERPCECPKSKWSIQIYRISANRVQEDKGSFMKCNHRINLLEDNGVNLDPCDFLLWAQDMTSSLGGATRSRTRSVEHKFVILHVMNIRRVSYMGLWALSTSIRWLCSPNCLDGS